MRLNFRNRKSSLNNSRVVAGQRSRAQCRFATYSALVFRKTGGDADEE